MGVILRTAGASRTKAEVKRDFEYLLRLWENVRELTLHSTAPTLVYEEGSLIKRSIRDLYNKDIDEILVAGEDAYREAKDFMRMLMPSHAKNVQPYRDTQPLFARNGIEAQLDAMFSPQVTLHSGGYLVINQTEALVSIDVNSGRSTREHNIEDTALQTNLEAAEEVARQLRLRDLAGLIVIDFIDMEEKRNNRSVERKLKDALKNDRARIQVGRISHFGLLEMSRQRIRTGVLESTTTLCPLCQGTGHVRAPASVALHVLRSLEDSCSRGVTHNLIDPHAHRGRPLHPQPEARAPLRARAALRPRRSPCWPTRRSPTARTSPSSAASRSSGASRADLRPARFGPADRGGGRGAVRRGGSRGRAARRARRPESRDSEIAARRRAAGAGAGGDAGGAAKALPSPKRLPPANTTPSEGPKAARPTRPRPRSRTSMRPGRRERERRQSQAPARQARRTARTARARRGARQRASAGGQRRRGLPRRARATMPAYAEPYRATNGGGEPDYASGPSMQASGAGRQADRFEREESGGYPVAVPTAPDLESPAEHRPRAARISAGCGAADAGRAFPARAPGRRERRGDHAPPGAEGDRPRGTGARRGTASPQPEEPGRPKRSGWWQRRTFF